MKNRYRYMMVIMTLLAILSALYTYTRVNDEIAVHWGRNGEADGYAPKQLLLLFPFLIPAFDLLLKLLFRLEPRKRNMQKSSSGYAVIRCNPMCLYDIHMPGGIVSEKDKYQYRRSLYGGNHDHDYRQCPSQNSFELYHRYTESMDA